MLIWDILESNLFQKWLLKSYIKKALQGHIRAVVSFFQQWMPRKKWARTWIHNNSLPRFLNNSSQIGFLQSQEPTADFCFVDSEHIPSPPCELHKIALILHTITDMACTGTMLHSYFTTTGTLTLADPIPWENVNRI